MNNTREVLSDNFVKHFELALSWPQSILAGKIVKLTAIVQAVAIFFRVPRLEWPGERP